LLHAFHRQFHALLTQLYSTFLQMAKNPEDALINESFIPHFTHFTATINEMGLSHSPSPLPSHPSPPSHPPPPSVTTDDRVHLSSIELGGLSSQSGGVQERQRGVSVGAVVTTRLPPAGEVS
jgi:hypothetical protein